MTFDGATWLPIARLCAAPLAGADEQASFRTAIGRAYYAPLLMIKRRVDAIQGAGTFPVDGSHSAVLAALRRSKIKEFERAAERLKVLRQQREGADYDLERAVDQNDVVSAIDRSRKLVEDLLPNIPNHKYARLSFY